MQYDVVIVGSGIAGLYAAVNIPKDKKVLLINKRESFKCNSFYAQGGIATAKDTEDIPSHIKDTLEAGSGLCDKDAVEILLKMMMEPLHTQKKQHIVTREFSMLVGMQQVGICICFC